MPLRCTVTKHIGPDSGSPYIYRNWGPGIPLDRIGSIWYRRPGAFVLPRYSSVQTERFAANELAMALGGILRSMDCFWMNRPGAIVEADYKVDQLVRATGIGLCVPDTCITSQPAHAKSFVTEHAGKVVIKVMGDPDIYAPDEGAEVVGNIFTSRVAESDLMKFDRVVDAPILLQEEISKQADIRVTIVGDAVFAVSIESPTGEASEVDVRKGGGPNLPHHIIELPILLRQQLVRLAHSYDLSFAAIDLVLAESGNYVFLELNPNGEWGWLERVTDLNISSSVATTLMKGIDSPGNANECQEEARGAVGL
jgi:glutathione synthase/RimK-type ligase-like ATP-grasp enzyme